MKIYLAGENYGNKIFPKVNCNFNRLDTFWGVFKGSQPIKEIHLYKDYILDSGAFTFMEAKKKGKELKVDLDFFTDAYIDYINAHDIDLFFEMDVESVTGYDKVKQLRKRIESKTGKRCIPVFHKERGRKDWEQTIKEYDYAAIGIAGKDVPWGDHKTFEKFVWSAAEQDCKLHGLGITGMRTLEKVPFHSVDSSSWSAGNRFKGVCRFNGERIVNVPVGNYRISEHEALALHNLKEWIKFCDFMETRRTIKG